MRIGNADTRDDVYIIAEIGGNHNGSPETARKLVEAAAKAGVNAVKFQTYTAETLVHPRVEPLPIVRASYKTQLERFKSLELDDATYRQIMELCGTFGVDFLTTPFDLEILDRFAPHMPAIKISSGDITFEDLIKRAASFGKPVIISTGMSDVADIERVVRLVPADRLVLLHCVSIYPLPPEKANLGALADMGKKWPGIVLGYSDHCVGIDACVAAITLGARVIEKHFTLDKSQAPGDHILSADPDDMAVLVEKTRQIRTLLGDGIKGPMEGEDFMRRKMRRGLYAARDLDAGHVLTARDILVIRPESDMRPVDAELIIGHPLKRPIKKYDAFGKGNASD